jgi:flagellar basal-body rod protein FlgF
VSTGIWSAASGMVTQSTALDVASENVANASTVGYRADRPVFRQILSQAGAVDPASRSMRYAVARSVQPDFKAGEIQETGNPLDVALTDNSSFFSVRTPEGDRYTRAGKFTLSSDGMLCTPEGYEVLGAGGQGISVPPGARVQIDATGGLVIDGEASGQQLRIVTFANVQGLIKEGAALLRARPETGAPLEVDATVRSGALEMSNSDAIKGMSGLVTATRQFEMLARVIDAFSQIERRAATDIAKR